MPLGDMVQTAATVSGIALALATLLKDVGWEVADVAVLPVAFIVAGLISLLGAVLAMLELWRLAELTQWPVLLMRLPTRRRRVDARDYYREALLVSGYGLVALLIVYVLLLFNLRSL